MDGMLNFQVIADNFTYFMIGRYPNGPLGGLGLTMYLAVVSCILSFFGGLILGLLSLSPIAAIRYPVNLLINTVRGLPLLMVIFWMYFLLPALLGKTVMAVTTGQSRNLAFCSEGTAAAGGYCCRSIFPLPITFW